MFKYFSDAFAEFKNIRWLSFGRAVYLTFLVLIFGLIASFLLGAMDSILASTLRGVIS